jgi:hypothetical protein
MNELAQLLGDAYAHADHGAAGPKRRNHCVPWLQRQATADSNRLLPFARKGLRGNLSRVPPAKQRVFE